MFAGLLRPEKETKNPFDVFGLFPEETTTTKQPQTLNGNFFVVLRMYNTAEDRWKKAVHAKGVIYVWQNTTVEVITKIYN